MRLPLIETPAVLQVKAKFLSRSSPWLCRLGGLFVRFLSSSIRKPGVPGEDVTAAPALTYNPLRDGVGELEVGCLDVALAGVASP